MKSPIDELDALHAKSSRSLMGALASVEVARLRKDKPGLKRAREDLSRRMSRLMATADLFGRRRLLLEVKALQKRTFAAERDVPFLPPVPFDEAIGDLLERNPELAPGWEETQRVYRDGGFAAARAASEKVAARIQSVLEVSQRRGTRADLVRQRIIRALESGKADAELVGIDPAGFTRAYADVVFRTVTASAYAAGRQRQARDPAVRQVIGGWRYVATLDTDVRPNHRAADNLVAHVDDPVWQHLSPPMGYQCRCSLEMVTVDEMKRLKLIGPKGGLISRARIPDGAYADPGFGRARYGR